MALAEILNVFPIFIRRVKLVRYIKWFIIGIALGKGFGALVFTIITVTVGIDLRRLK